MLKMTLNLVASFILIGASAPTYAAVIFYTNEADFLAAAGAPEATMAFEGLAPADSLISGPNPYTEDGITLTNLGLIIDDGYSSGVYDIGTGASGQIYRETTASVSYAVGPIFAGGATVFTVQADANHAIGSAHISLSSGEASSVATSSVNGESFFIGFVSNTPVDFFNLFANTTTIDANARWLEVDNILLTTTPPPSVPVVSSAWLFGLGLLGLAAGTARTKTRTRPHSIQQ